MKFKSLQIKLVIIFGLCLVIAVGAVMLYGIVSTHRTEQFVNNSSNAVMTATAKELLFEKAKGIGLAVEVELEVALDSARTMADMFSGIKDQRVNLNIDRDKMNGILRSVLEKNNIFLGTYTVWEPNALDGLDDLYAGTEGHDQTGRFIPYWNRSEDGVIKLDPLMDYESQETYENGVRKGDYYLLPRERQKECAIDPYAYPIQGKLVWMTSLVVPIMVENRFYGMAGVDMRVDFIQALVAQMDKEFYAGAGKIAIVSHQGILAAVSDNPEMMGKPLKDWMVDDWQQDLEVIQSGKGKIDLKEQSIEIIVPLKIGRTESPWAVDIEMPKDIVLTDVHKLAQELSARGTQDLVWEIVVGLGITLVGLLVIVIISRGIARPLKLAATVADQISEGNLHVEFAIRSQDEVGQVLMAMKRMIGYLQEVAGVAEKVSNKNLQVAVVPKSEHDVLNQSLTKMVTNLDLMMKANEQSMAEIEQRNQAMQQQNWLKDGIGQLSTELSGEPALIEVCRKAINFTARYVSAGQGVLYVYDPEREHLKLYGTFAFTERDEIVNTCKLGEGVVGQVALERIPILLKHPERDERLIMTGTVSGVPFNTYTFPLLYEHELYGVLELGSFEPFDATKQEFLTEANRVIATAIFSTAQRERVEELLQRSQEAAKEAEYAKGEAQQQAEAAQRANVLLEEKQQELTQQAEELRQMNTQLEEREQQLRQQQEELRQQNKSLKQAQAELESRTRELEVVR